MLGATLCCSCDRSLSTKPATWSSSYYGCMIALDGDNESPVFHASPPKVGA